MLGGRSKKRGVKTREFSKTTTRHFASTTAHNSLHISPPGNLQKGREGKKPRRKGEKGGEHKKCKKSKGKSHISAGGRA